MLELCHLCECLPLLRKNWLHVHFSASSIKLHLTYVDVFTLGRESCINIDKRLFWHLNCVMIDWQNGVWECKDMTHPLSKGTNHLVYSTCSSLIVLSVHRVCMCSVEPYSFINMNILRSLECAVDSEWHVIVSCSVVNRKGKLHVTIKLVLPPELTPGLGMLNGWCISEHSSLIAAASVVPPFLLLHRYPQGQISRCWFGLILMQSWSISSMVVYSTSWLGNCCKHHQPIRFLQSHGEYNI